MKNQMMKEFKDLLDEGIQIADQIRQASGNDLASIRQVQSAMSNFSKEKQLPQVVERILTLYPETRNELQMRIIAFMGEGKRLENSLIK